MSSTTFAGKPLTLKETVDKATDEYRKYKARTLSEVEQGLFGFHATWILINDVKLAAGANFV